MDEKTAIQLMYKQMKEDCNNDTNTIYEFVKWLHKEMNQAKYLLEIEDLGVVERGMIQDIVKKKER